MHAHALSFALSSVGSEPTSTIAVASNAGSAIDPCDGSDVWTRAPTVLLTIWRSNGSSEPTTNKDRIFGTFTEDLEDRVAHHHDASHETIHVARVVSPIGTRGRTWIGPPRVAKALFVSVAQYVVTTHALIRDDLTDEQVAGLSPELHIAAITELNDGDDTSWIDEHGAKHFGKIGYERRDVGLGRSGEARYVQCPHAENL
jgi:hypothetical protein